MRFYGYIVSLPGIDPFIFDDVIPAYVLVFGVGQKKERRGWEESKPIEMATPKDGFRGGGGALGAVAPPF